MYIGCTYAYCTNLMSSANIIPFFHIVALILLANSGN